MVTHKIECKNGLALILTDEQVEAVFRYREREYRIRDAESHFLEHVDEDITDDEFKDIYGITITDACDKNSDFYILNDLVDMFEDKIDCNLTENDIWDNIIEVYLSELKECKK